MRANIKIASAHRKAKSGKILNKNTRIWQKTSKISQILNNKDLNDEIEVE